MVVKISACWEEYQWKLESRTGSFHLHQRLLSKSNNLFLKVLYLRTPCQLLISTLCWSWSYHIFIIYRNYRHGKKKRKDRGCLECPYWRGLNLEMVSFKYERTIWFEMIFCDSSILSTGEMHTEHNNSLYKNVKIFQIQITVNGPTDDWGVAWPRR